jgi:hypothetical protein
MSKNANLFFRILTWLFIAGVVSQVLLAGLTVVVGQINWETHVTLGHILALPLILMLITMYVAKADKQVKYTTWILFVTYALQADVLIFLRLNEPPLSYLSALHPVLALIDFWLAMRLLGLTKAAA